MYVRGVMLQPGNSAVTFRHKSDTKNISTKMAYRFVLYKEAEATKTACANRREQSYRAVGTFMCCFGNYDSESLKIDMVVSLCAV